MQDFAGQLHGQLLENPPPASAVRLDRRSASCDVCSMGAVVPGADQVTGCVLREPPSAPQATLYVVVCALGNTVSNPSLVTWTGASPPTRGTTHVTSAGCTPPSRRSNGVAT